MFDPNLIMRKQSDNCRIWDILPVSFKDVNVMRQKKDEMTFRLGDERDRKTTYNVCTLIGS